jgi:type VI protein secretion system component VasF
MTQEPSALQNLLSAVTEAILNDEQDLDVIVDRYAVPRADVEGLVHLIQRLHIVLVGVRPSRRFAQRLRQDLMGQQMSMVNRLRYLPPRVQIAGGIALVIGFMLLSRRRMGSETPDAQEAPALR